MSRTVEYDLRRLGGLRAAGGAAPERLDGLLEPAEIEVESHRLGVPRLLRAEQVPRPADLQVLEGDPVPGAEVGVVLEDLEPVFGGGVDHIGGDEVAVGPPVAPPHPAPELV